MKLDFDDELSCIIGGRGTGKTTVLEAIRFVLDRLPDNHSRQRRRRIESLLENNIASGVVRASIVTRDGVTYQVERATNSEALVTDEDGVGVDISIGGDIVFGIDIYSQNEIEEMASDSFSQLQLIDQFIRGDVRELERKIADTVRLLETNAANILERRRFVDDLTEATRELPDIAERIRGFSRSTREGANSDSEYTARSQRVREGVAATNVSAFVERTRLNVEQLAAAIKREATDVTALETQGANGGLVQDIVKLVVEGSENATKLLAAAQAMFEEVGIEVARLTSELEHRHREQEAVFRELVESENRERAMDAERLRLERRHVELLDLARKRANGEVELHEFLRQRADLRARLSTLRDERFKKRADVVTKLNAGLNPMIRVELEQFGNIDPYRTLLMDAMKGSGLRYRTIVEQCVDAIPPGELSRLVQTEDREALAQQLQIDTDRATRFMIQLKDRPEVFELEVVDLHDKPTVKLRDGEQYKESAQLSTGQKCTTILPILLLESERPLLIDQPEDNLDNAFIFETVVRSIRAVKGRRQLIFVTHNPNIPVLGDAGRVFCLHSSGRSAVVVGAGAVDEVADHIIDVLEGGREAFEARRKRYGDSQSDKPT